MGGHPSRFVAFVACPAESVHRRLPERSNGCASPSARRAIIARCSTAS
jgi:hypothetical protein